MFLSIRHLLQTVLGGAQEAVRIGQIGDRVLGQMAPLAENSDHIEYAAIPQLRLTPSAHHLESLSGELDLADPSRSQLDVVVQPLALDLVGDEGLHVANGFEHAEIQIAPVDEGSQPFEDALAAAVLTGDRTRSNERIALPVPAVTLVVVLEGIEVQRHGAGAAEGP